MILCVNCGDEILRRNAGHATDNPLCMKPECRKVHRKLREERRKQAELERGDEIRYGRPFKSVESYAPVEFDALGKAVNPDIFNKLINGSHRQCDKCVYNPTCRQRVKLGLWVLCESAAKHEREFIENNPELMVELVKLSTVVIG